MNGAVKSGVAVLVLAAVGYGAWRLHDRRDVQPLHYRTVPVTRGDLVVTIAATGTVEPEEVVDVGAQVAGRIESFGRDEQGKAVDYGSRVKAGAVLAQIDEALYTADVALAKAQFEQASAGVSRAEADLGPLQAKLDQATRDWERAQKLGPGDALAQVDYDAYRAAFETATASLTVGRAAVTQAKATVGPAQAALDRSQKNLSYCTIRAPVDGVIVDRRVNIGQTVVASLNAPSLFLIAKDLARMQVWVAVNEADVGAIRAGQPVTFTVDAFPTETMHGTVNKVRLNAAMTQNVVTYTVEVTTDNSSGRLLPYLTANAKFEVQHDRDVFLVPNAALRWTPPAARGGSPAPAAESRDGRGATVWILDGATPRAVAVRVGPTDGVSTEVSGDAIAESAAVVVDDDRERTEGGDGASSSANPFTPQFNRTQQTQQRQGRASQ
jgi:HlyD family secretion protein